MLDSMKAARLIRRAMLPIAILLGFLLYWNYGWLRVPVGMDTMPGEYPAGTLCLIDKRPSRLVEGSVVFVDLAEGGTLLARVAAVVEQGFWLKSDNPDSRFAERLQAEAMPRESIRALVLTSFSAEAGPDGR
ncbi:MAG: S24/S26 family peptidase [Planctomycetota bacterium]